MFLYLLRRVKVIWKPSDYTNLLFLVNVSQHNQWLSDSHTLIISISLSWAEFSASPLAVLITPLCASDYPRLVKTYFPLMVNKKVGACQHTSADDVGLSAVLSASARSGRTHTRTYEDMHGRTCFVCVSLIMSRHWNAITRERGEEEGCVKWVGATQHSLVFIRRNSTSAEGRAEC